MSSIFPNKCQKCTVCLFHTTYPNKLNGAVFIITGYESHFVSKNKKIEQNHGCVTLLFWLHAIHIVLSFSGLVRAATIYIVSRRIVSNSGPEMCSSSSSIYRRKDLGCDLAHNIYSTPVEIAAAAQESVHKAPRAQVYTGVCHTWHDFMTQSSLAHWGLTRGTRCCVESCQVWTNDDSGTLALSLVAGTVAIRGH